MSGQGLSESDQLLSELYSLKIIVTALVSEYLHAQLDINVAANALEGIVSNSIDAFDFRDLQEPKLSMAREAVRERAISLISNAANPQRMTQDRRL
jgi:hypothetical protein